MGHKYKIEGNINFYEELYKSLDDSKDDSKEDEIEQNICLITNEPLTVNFVNMKCGHKFNYIPLFNDLVNHKKKYNSMERRILKSMEIRCPYCRNVQKELLPFHETMNVKQVHGVNHYDEPEIVNKQDSAPNYSKGKCCYEALNYMGESVSCTNKYVATLNLDGKCYCSYHKYSAIKKITAENKLKIQKEKMVEKEKVKQAKETLATNKALEKMAVKKAKEDAKIAKEDAKIAKEDAKKTKGVKQLVSITHLNPEENTIIIVGNCQQLVKSGPNKGNPCGCKSNTIQNNMCLRHFKSTM